MSVLFANNSLSTLAASISDVATSATLATGTGARFPNPTGSDYFMLTFSDAATGLTNEIVKVTGRSGDVLTIVRAQEGTSAQNWSAGDGANGLITAGALGEFFQGDAGLFEDGTVGAPGAAFINDLDTGLYRPGTNILGLVAGGVEFLRSTASLITLNLATLISGILTIPLGHRSERLFLTNAVSGTWYDLITPGTGTYRYDVIVGCQGGGGGRAVCTAAKDNASAVIAIMGTPAASGTTTIEFQISGNKLQVRQTSGGPISLACAYTTITTDA